MAWELGLSVVFISAYADPDAIRYAPDAEIHQQRAFPSFCTCFAYLTYVAYWNFGARGIYLMGSLLRHHI